MQCIIIECVVLPVGSLLEEIQESWNKDYKYYPIQRSRKCSRLAINEGLFHMKVITSDPLITNLRPESKMKSLPFTDEALNLLLKQLHIFLISSYILLNIIFSSLLHFLYFSNGMEKKLNNFSNLFKINFLFNVHLNYKNCPTL